jgi:hypothetical protein
VAFSLACYKPPACVHPWQTWPTCVHGDFVFLQIICVSAVRLFFLLFWSLLLACMGQSYLLNLLVDLLNLLTRPLHCRSLSRTARHYRCFWRYRHSLTTRRLALLWRQQRSIGLCARTSCLGRRSGSRKLSRATGRHSRASCWRNVWTPKKYSTATTSSTTSTTNTNSTTTWVPLLPAVAMPRGGELW